jgi:hypothetical protein
MVIKHDAVEALELLREEIEERLEQIENILRDFPEAETRARAYWLAHIRTALRDDSDYLGGSAITMDDTIREIDGELNADAE